MCFDKLTVIIIIIIIVIIIIIIIVIIIDEHNCHDSLLACLTEGNRPISIY